MAGEQLLRLRVLARLVQAQAFRAGRGPRGRRGHRDRGRAAATPRGRSGATDATLGRLVCRHGGDARHSGRCDERRTGDDQADPGARAHGRTVAGNTRAAPTLQQRRARICQPTHRYTQESNGYVQRASRAGQGRHRRGLLRRCAPTPRRGETGRCCSTSASRTSGTRVISRAQCTCPVAISSRASKRCVPDKSREIIVYCAGGSRSAFAAKSLAELGYDNVVSMAGGFTDWKRNGFDFQTPRALTSEQRARYSTAHPDPGGRRGGAAEAARRTRPPDRGRRARLAGLALSRGSRSRHPRHRRRRRRRRLEPAAADRALDEHARGAQGAVGEACRSRRSTPTWT